MLSVTLHIFHLQYHCFSAPSLTVLEQTSDSFLGHNLPHPLRTTGLDLRLSEQTCIMMQCARPPIFNIVNHVWILTSTLLSWLDCPVLYFYTKLDKKY